MSFKVVSVRQGIYNDDEYMKLAETDKLRGNVVIGRTNNRTEYEDRETVADYAVDEYAKIPGGNLEPPLSRNHIYVSENAGYNQMVGTGFETEKLDTGQMDFDIWDLDSYAGTQIDGYDTETGNPIYDVAGELIQIKPMNHYLGFSGAERDMENDIRAMAENLGNRGFETTTIPNASWEEVESSLERIEKMTETDSNTIITYSGHGSRRGEMCLDDERVLPPKMIETVSQIEGEKILLIDQCFAGKFAHDMPYDVPDDMSVFMASGPDDKAKGKSMIQGERRGRYLGRIAQALGQTSREVSMNDIHRKVTAVGKVSSHNPIQLGYSPNISQSK